MPEISKRLIYGLIPKLKKQKFPWGAKRTLCSKWGELKINSYFLDFQKEVGYSDWADVNSENLCIVENGFATITWHNKIYRIGKKHVFKIYAGQKPVIKPKEKFTILSIQLQSSKQLSKKHRVKLDHLDVVNTDSVPSKVYEFETLGQEVFTPRYKPGLGLIKFAFVNPIPLHKHPFSARLIRPITGKGFTFMEPNIYEAHKDTFAFIPKGLIHTNGNIPGSVLRLYAIQIPWIASRIDEKNIAGSPEFVRYVGITPPKELWKKKADFERLIKKLERR